MRPVRSNQRNLWPRMGCRRLVSEVDILVRQASDNKGRGFAGGQPPPAATQTTSTPNTRFSDLDETKRYVTK